MIKRFLILLAVLPMLACCGPKPEVPEEPGKTEEPDTPEVPDKPEEPDKPVTPTIVYDGETKIALGLEAGSGTIVFKANLDWTIESSKSWLVLEPLSGQASDNEISVAYTYEQNPTSKKRSANVTIAISGAEKYITFSQSGDPMAGAAAELHSGDVVQATNPLVEKFLTEVNYPDKTCTEYTEIFNYYGGFDGTNFTWDNWGKEWPDGDIPCQYSIRWNPSDVESGTMNLHMEDELGWSGDLEIAAGSPYVNISNLVPNDHYTYSVTAASGKVLSSGSFSTKGVLHQVYFHGDPQTPNIKGGGGRNARDFGGWKTLDGKTIKYRKVYRGGRLNEKWTPYPLNAQGEKEVLFEGLGGELDLRGTADVIFEPAVAGLAHCAPVIEEGGISMLVTDHEKTKQCFEFVVNCVREGKPVYFHCSLGRDRTGTLGILLLGLLGVREGDIAKEYELTYFAPVGYSVSSSDKKTNAKPVYRNTRMAWVYSDVTPYFWELAGDGTFAQGVEKYLLEVAGVSQKDIDDFRALMLTD